MTAERSDAQLVLDLMDAFRRSKAMFAAVSLGIFDRLEMSPAGTRELSAEKKCHPGALERLLDTCVALDLLGRQGERYRNLPVAARYLCQDSPDTLAGYILYSNQILYSLWGHLEDAVREGASRWEQTFGGKTSLFEGLFATEESKRDFLQAMHGMGRLSSPSVVASVDLSSFRRLCDVGGATGHLAMAACSRYPGLQATVFDLPEVAPGATLHRRGGVGRADRRPGGGFFSRPAAAGRPVRPGPHPARLVGRKNHFPSGKNLSTIAGCRRLAGLRKNPEPRQGRAPQRQFAIAEHAGVDRRRPGAHGCRI